MSEEPGDLEWAKVKMRAAVRSARRFANEEDRINSYVAALAEPLRQSQEVANAKAVNGQTFGMIVRERDLGRERIEELEAALRPAIERCQCQKRVLLDAWIPCEACREAAALLDTEAKP